MTNGNMTLDPTQVPGGIPGVNMTLDPTQVSTGFPGVDGGGGGGGGAFSVDIGNGQIAILDAAGNVLAIRSAPSAPSPGAAYHPPAWKPGELDVQRRGAAVAERGVAVQERQLAQFDRQLNATIKQQQADLAEKRRQFDKSLGFEREKLAAEIRMLDKQLANNLQIARLDAGTRLNIANMEGQVALRGQDISREQFGAEMGARRAEFAISALRDDPVAQGMFMLGETGGTTPLEIAAQQFPRMGPVDVRDVNPAQMPKYQAGGTIPPGGVGLVGETQPEVVRDIPGGGTQVIPTSPYQARVPGSWEEIDKYRTPGYVPDYRLQGGYETGGLVEAARRRRSQMRGATLPDRALESFTDPVERARETLRRLLGGTFGGDIPLEFGGLPQMEPVFGVDVEAPGQMAYRYSQLPGPLRQVARSAWGVRNMPAEEAFRRMRAATPRGLPAGFRMGYR